MVNFVVASLKGLDVLTVQRLSKTSFLENATNSELASSYLLVQLLVVELVYYSYSCSIDLHAHNLSVTEHHSPNPLIRVILYMSSFDSNNYLF